MSTPFWIAGHAEHGRDEVEIRSPYDGTLVGSHTRPTAGQLERAVAAAHSARGAMRDLSAADRAAALDHVGARLSARLEEVARLITAENGKPLMWSRVEVSRAASTFRWAAEEARRFSGDLQRLDTDAAGAGRMAVVRRFAHGPVLGIAPFNFPLNLVVHKVAPAIAVGAPIVVKPAPSTPLTALLLGEILAETDLPVGAWSVLPVANDVAPSLVVDDRLPVVSFTGSEPVGFAIQKSVPHKHVTLELGGNAAAIVAADWSSDADLSYAAQRIATFGTYSAGQACIKVQRVLVDVSLYDVMVEKIVDAVRGLTTGSPWDDDTVVGPVIDERAAVRIGAWVDEAVQQGAKVLVGGGRSGTMVEPTVMVNVPEDARVSCDEVFGPVLTVTPVDGLDDAFARVNSSRFGLQTGIFTHDIATAFRAHRELEVGGVIVGDVPTFRADQMPYGGTKASGVGREGVRAAMDDLTYERVLVLSGVSL